MEGLTFTPRAPFVSIIKVACRDVSNGPYIGDRLIARTPSAYPLDIRISGSKTHRTG